MRPRRRFVIPFRCVSGLHRDALSLGSVFTAAPGNRTTRDESSDGVRSTPTGRQSLRRGWFGNKRDLREVQCTDDKNGSVEKSRFAKSERNSALRNLRGRQHSFTACDNDERREKNLWRSTANHFTTHICVHDHLPTLVRKRYKSCLLRDKQIYLKREAEKSDNSTY